MLHRARSPLFATVFIVLGVSLLVLVARGLGAVESLELAAYDWYIRLRPADPRASTRVVLVTVTEQDIQDLGNWPLPDGVLARALERLAEYGPRAIGLDIYRDVPVPPGTDELIAVLTREQRIIAAMKFGEGTSPGVPPPAALRDTSRIGFNDVLVDPGGIVRRGLLFLDDGVSVYHSLALRLALLHLQAEGVTLQPDPQTPTHLRLAQTTIRPLEPNDGAYVGADTRGYQFLLDFRDRPGAVPSFSLGELFDRRLDAQAFRDKVVIVGVTAESVKDHFYTPYSRGADVRQHAPGVEVHAQIVSQLLRTALDGAPPVRTLPEWQEVVWTILWGAAGGLTGLRLRSPWRLTLAAAAGLSGLGGLTFVAFQSSWWLPVLPPALGWLVSAGGVTAYVSYQETVQRADLMQLFSRHVSKEVAESIWQHRDQFLDGRRPRPERVEITALFTDLTGFTTVAESLDPEALMEWLNEFMGALAREVSRHGGVIRQYAGDSIVAVFGVPLPRRTAEAIRRDAVNAVHCALGMEATLLALNKRWQEEQRPTTGMRIGIFTGPAVAGSLGSAERSEYVVVGDTMNTASRLENFAKELFPPDPLKNPCRIFLGESTLRLLGDGFETEWVGEVSLKGKQHRVGVYRLVGRASSGDEALSGEGRR